MQSAAIPSGVPNQLGKYRLLFELGHGGMARVFLAVAHGPNQFAKLLVLKMLRDELALEPESVEMFSNEARLAGRLNHPHVVQTYEVGEFDGRHIIVMEYLEGESLYSVLSMALRHETPFPLVLHLRTISDALLGLKYAHELKDFGGQPIRVVHRDVSPQNIFMTYEGQVKLLDFGIAKAVSSSIETRAGIFKGKLGYMAPEQFLGVGVDHRADLFAMGVVLWEAVTGQRLWKGLPQPRIIHRIISGDFPSPASATPGVHPRLNEICMKAMAREPDERYSSAAEMHEDLEEVIGSMSSQATSRDLSNYMSTTFAERRAEVSQLIERQLEYARGTTSGEYAAVSLPSAPLVLSSTQESKIVVTDIRIPEMTPTAGAGFANSGARASENGSGNVSAAPRKNKTAIALVAVSAALVLALVTIGTRSSQPESAQADSASKLDVPPVATSASPVDPLPAVSPTPVATAEKRVSIQISAVPQMAKIFFDDQEVPTNPYTKVVVRGSDLHRVRVEAPGFADQAMEITSDEDREIQIRLKPIVTGATHVDRKKPERPAPAASEQPPKPTPPKPAMTELPSGPPPPKPGRPVDTNSPWD